MEIRTALLEILAEVDQLIEENDAARALERRIVTRPTDTASTVPIAWHRGISKGSKRSRSTSSAIARLSWNIRQGLRRLSRDLCRRARGRREVSAALTQSSLSRTRPTPS